MIKKEKVYTGEKVLGGINMWRLLPFALFFLLLSCSNSTVNEGMSEEEGTDKDTELKVSEEVETAIQEEIVEMIKKCEFEEVKSELKGKNDEISRNLYNYANARSIWDEAAGEGLNALYFVDPHYSGVLSDEIKEFANQGNPNDCNRFDGPDVDRSDWFTFYNHNTDMYTDPSSIDPEIGMSKEDVLNSTWGEPEKKNKTTTENGVSEQWVYSDFRYLYFEDGKLTTIQE